MRTSKPSEQYWRERIADERERLMDACAEDIDYQLSAEYQKLINKAYLEMRALVSEIREKGHDNVLASHLYQYDKYYELVNSLNNLLTKLGQAEVKILTDDLTALYKYNSGMLAQAYGLTTDMDESNAKKAVGAIWCGDGDNYSDRIWKNKSALMDKLQSNLVDCCAGGWSMAEFKRQLMQSFNTSYANAHRIAVTEASYVYNKSTLDKFAEAGVTHYQIIAEPDACPDCKALVGKRIPITKQVLPGHPRCSCVAVAIINKGD